MEQGESDFGSRTSEFGGQTWWLPGVDTAGGEA